MAEGKELDPERSRNARRYVAVLNYTAEDRSGLPMAPRARDIFAQEMPHTEGDRHQGETGEAASANIPP